MTARYSYDRGTVPAYEPDDVPDELRERICESEAKFLEPEFMADAALDWLQVNAAEKGVDVEALETWTLFVQGEGAGVRASVVDLGKFVDAVMPDLPAKDRARILAADRIEGLSLRAEPGRGYRPRTVADVDLRNPHDRFMPEVHTGWHADGWPIYDYDPAHKGTPAAKAMQAALDRLESAWESYVADLEGDVVSTLHADYESATSWETIAQRIRDLDELVTADGDIVSRSDCAQVDDDSEGDA